MPKRTAAVLLFAFTVTIVAACAPQTPSTAAPTGTAPAQAAKSTAAWYADMLRAQGFYVFPEPVDLTPFTVQAVTGAPLVSSSLTGRITLLNFWATWCPPCREEMPSIERLHKAMEGSAFGIVAISDGEKRAVVEDFLKRTPYSYPIYLDESGEVSAAYVSRGIPTTFIVGKDGKVIAGVVGALEYDTPGMIAAFRELATR